MIKGRLKYSELLRLKMSIAKDVMCILGDTLLLKFTYLWPWHRLFPGFCAVAAGRRWNISCMGTQM